MEAVTLKIKKLRNAALLAVPLAGVLVLFANACGTLHGRPACGPLSVAATPIVVLPLFVEHTLFSGPQGDTIRRLMLWFVAYFISLGLVLLVFWLRAVIRRT